MSEKENHKKKKPKQIIYPSDDEILTCSTILERIYGANSNSSMQSSNSKRLAHILRLLNDQQQGIRKEKKDKSQRKRDAIANERLKLYGKFMLLQ